MFVRENPATFVPENGAWGRQGCTAVRLDAVDEDTLGEAMTLAWQNIARNPRVAHPGPVKQKRAGARRPSDRTRRG